ncbi:MAG: hypothetical protein H7X88_01815 [Gloeobacteraceae cyanobacterium ES-bin-316]|nr:hypothetical protein [Ferruginibacter sp.]
MKNNQPVEIKEFIPQIGQRFKVKWSRNPDIVGEVYEVNPHEKFVRLLSPKTRIKWNGNTKWDNLIPLK